MIAAFCLAFIIAALSASTQAVTGFGFGLLAIPLLALLFGPATAISTAVILGFALMFAVSIREFHAVDWRIVLVTGSAAYAGLPVGVMVLGAFSAQALTIIISVVVLALAATLATGVSWRSRQSTDLAAGFVSGVLQTSTGMSGPVLVLALQGRNMHPRRFRGTLSACFAVQNLGAVAALALAGHASTTSAVLAATCVPGAAFGWLAGDRLFHRFSVETLRALALSLVVASALAGLVGAVV